MIYRFNVADLNAIETRVGAWLAGCNSLLNVFQPRPGKPNGNCPYLDFACKIFNLNYDWLEEQYNKKDKDAKSKRKFAKPGVLGCIYRMGGGGWGNGKSSYVDPETGKKVYDRIRTGLWGYAWGMGVELTQEQANMVVRVFRESYPEIPRFWEEIENAVLAVMDPKHSSTRRFIGPNGCVMIDRLNIEERQPIMRIHLPSGRKLHYVGAFVRDTKMPWQDRDGNDVYRPALWYAHENQTTGVWELTSTHGGKLFENMVQGIARDVLAVKMLEIETFEMPICGHVHDECISEVPDDIFSPTSEDMVKIMSKEVFWAPGLLLGADGFSERFYHK